MDSLNSTGNLSSFNVLIVFEDFVLPEKMKSYLSAGPSSLICCVLV